MLTPKQEQFCKNVALDGMNYSEAYRNAYNTKGMTDKTINERASRLKDEYKVSTRIKELRSEIDSPRIMNATKRAERLTEFAADADPNVAMKAIDLLNKMTGEYVQRVEADVKNEVTISIELSDDE